MLVWRARRPNCHWKPLRNWGYLRIAAIIADARDAQGNLLPDAERLTRFGRFLRSTSLDERNLAWQQ